MGPLDALWHLLNFAYPAVALGAIAAGLAKLLWRRELAARPWRVLARDTAIACGLVLVAGLVIFGRDGRMATYAAMVAACALTLWWRGFGR
jgi:membrane-associated PAP2 superfamily phosphatase